MFGWGLYKNSPNTCFLLWAFLSASNRLSLSFSRSSSSICFSWFNSASSSSSTILADISKTFAIASIDVLAMVATLELHRQISSKRKKKCKLKKINCWRVSLSEKIADLGSKLWGIILIKRINELGERERDLLCLHLMEVAELKSNSTN